MTMHKPLVVIIKNLLWYPVLVPQITGDPDPPAVETLKVSSIQSPMALPAPAATAAFCAAVSPKTGLAIWNDWIRWIRYAYSNTFDACISYRKVVANSTNIIITWANSESTLIDSTGRTNISRQEICAIIICSLPASQSNYKMKLKWARKKPCRVIYTYRRNKRQSPQRMNLKLYPLYRYILVLKGK